MGMSVPPRTGVEIRDGLTTEMTYAVVAGDSDLGHAASGHGNDGGFWGMLKPPYEAFKIVELLRSWGARVFVVNPFETNDDPGRASDQTRYSRLADLPEAVDCAILSFHPRHLPTIVNDVLRSRIPVVWLQYALMKSAVEAELASHGVRVVSGCVLLHWEVDHVAGLQQGRHICRIHSMLARAWRIRRSPDGILERLPPLDVRAARFSRETFGAKLIAPLYPDAEVLR